MDPDTFRGDVGVEGPEVYWRRRVSVLTGALVVVAVIAWACSSASGGAGGRPSSDGATGPGPAPSTTVVPETAPSVPSPAATATAATSSPTPRRSRRPGGRCDQADLVVGLVTEAEVYAGGRAPSFLLTVVNLGRSGCTVDVGPRAVEVRVTSGADRVWSTADCVSGEGADVRRLERGVPHVRTVGWDRRRSAPDCRAARPEARRGTYVATARLGPLKSSKVVFHLR
ncbi:hypothetical protein Sme01_45550 [Sphaerisporangium melleum]|uniref:DUF4232 domain-containing protein n=1 Tax=Sphaerisporangium melleum TaxID=321316 RepID=A0A917R0M0_9ACTN|nr:hypothetical protein [Sphaerisporangium melleum]GGK80154.1 hypothetical protein GCM10007964_23530 [Sphaerisporangium melleum]GII72079.1 hypothetical protein Sme01_45550 [Sphaerisporangium melleum]